VLTCVCYPQRIAFSNEVNASRLKVLTARDEVLSSVKAVVTNELGETRSPGDCVCVCVCVCVFVYLFVRLVWRARLGR